jgi:hypothetical protein
MHRPTESAEESRQQNFSVCLMAIRLTPPPKSVLGLADSVVVVSAELNVGSMEPSVFGGRTCPRITPHKHCVPRRRSAAIGKRSGCPNEIIVAEVERRVERAIGQEFYDRARRWSLRASMLK